MEMNNEFFLWRRRLASKEGVEAARGAPIRTAGRRWDEQFDPANAGFSGDWPETSGRHPRGVRLFRIATLVR